jgi:hypothetical protein
MTQGGIAVRPIWILDAGQIFQTCEGLDFPSVGTVGSS